MHPSVFAMTDRACALGEIANRQLVIIYVIERKTGRSCMDGYDHRRATEMGTKIPRSSTGRGEECGSTEWLG